MGNVKGSVVSSKSSVRPRASESARESISTTEGRITYCGLSSLSRYNQIFVWTHVVCKNAQREFLNNNPPSVRPSSMHQHPHRWPRRAGWGRGRGAGHTLGIVAREPSDCDVQRPPTNMSVCCPPLNWVRWKRNGRSSFFGHPIECAAVPLCLWLRTMGVTDMLAHGLAGATQEE